MFLVTYACMYYSESLTVCCDTQNPDTLFSLDDDGNGGLTLLQKGKLLNMAHRHPTRLQRMWVGDTRLITASPDTPGTLTVLSYW